MKLYVLEDVEYLTERYHCTGGLVVVAVTLEDAKALVAEKITGATVDGNPLGPTDAEWGAAHEYDLLHGGYEQAVYVFPNAGCC